MRPFEIKFDFPVASSNLKISLNATAEQHHSETYYKVRHFYLANSEKNNEHHSVLPDQEIKRIKRNGSFVWVHKDSEKESKLSMAIGAGIENKLSKHEIHLDQKSFWHLKEKRPVLRHAFLFSEQLVSVEFFHCSKSAFSKNATYPFIFISIRRFFSLPALVLLSATG